MTMRRMIGVLVLVLVGSCGPLSAQEPKELLLPSGPQSIDIQRDLGCTPIDYRKAATFTVAVGKTNAAKIQAALAALGSAHHKAIVAPPRHFAIADHDDDGIDIVWPAVWGGTFYGVGRNPSPVVTKSGLADHSYYQCAFAFVHVGDAGDTMFQYRGSHGDLQANFIGRLVQSNNALNTARSSGNHAGVGLQIAYQDTPTTMPGAKLRLTGVFSVLDVGLQVQAGASHTDNIYSDVIYFQHCNTYYQVLNDQSVHHIIKVFDCDGSPCDVGFHFEKGGDLLVGSCYHPHGTLLRIGDGAGGIANNVTNYEITQLKLDQIISEQIAADDYLVDCLADASAVRVRIGGSFSADPGKQMVRYLSRVSESAPDIQLDIKDMNIVEAAAYPRRPIRGWTAPEFYETSAFASTKLWINPNDISEWTHAVDAGSGEDRISKIADSSGTGNDLTVACADVSPVLVSPYGINWRPSVMCNSGTLRYARNEAPTDLHNAVGDLTVMAIAMLDNGNANHNTLIACRDDDGSGGWEMGVNSNLKPYFTAGGQTVTHVMGIEKWRPYLFIGKRDSTTGGITITVEGIESDSVTGSTGTQTAVTGWLIVGGRQNSGAANPVWRGWFGPIFVDLALLDAAQTTERLNYLRAGWGVW